MAMQKVWMGMASSAISSLTKIIEQNALFTAMHGIQAEKNKLLSAKTAAAKAMEGAPFPLNIPLAIAAFAATMSFAHGGIADQDGGAMIHKREMVLPPHISDFVQKAASKDVGGGQGGGDHFHYSPTVQAIDRNGMEDALKEHGDTMFSVWKEQMRNRNISM
jgi:hypothetical protein